MKKCPPFVFIFISPTISLAANLYTPTLISSPIDGVPNVAQAVSQAGSVGHAFVGNVGGDNPGTYQPTFFKNGQTTFLPVPAGGQGDTLAINDAGDAVGYVWTAGQPNTQPAYWQDGRLQTLPTLNMPGGRAITINDYGMIAGTIENSSSTNSPPVGEAILWNGGNATILGNFPNAQAAAQSINNQGQILINATYSDHSEAWLYSSDGSLIRISSPTAIDISGNALNNLGEVVGSALFSGREASSAFLSKNGVITPLSDLPNETISDATSINDQDQIVGYAESLTDGPVATLWQDNAAFNLNDLIPADSGWTLNVATSIDNLGDIVGYGYFNGQPSSFELTQTFSEAAIANTPEPASLTLLTLAALPLLTRRRH